MVEHQGRNKANVTDGSKAFANVKVKAWLARRSIDNIFSLPNDRKANGLTERFNCMVWQSIGKCQCKRVEVQWWDTVKIIEVVVNRAHHRVLRMTPEEAWVASPQKRKGISDRQQSKKDRRNVSGSMRKKEEEYQVDDPVWVYQQERMQRKSLHRLHPRWIALCRLVERQSQHIWKTIVVRGRTHATHVDLLRPDI